MRLEHQRTDPIPYLSFGLLLVLLSCLTARANPVVSTEAYNRGESLYQIYCAGCHQVNGEGIPHIFPPLANSDYLMADHGRTIRIMLRGLRERITVNGNEYYGIMPPPEMKDDEIADTLTYVYNAWGNEGPVVLPQEITTERIRLDELASNRKEDPYPPVPSAPEGFKLREVVRMDTMGTRLADHPDIDWIYVLEAQGTLYRLHKETDTFEVALAIDDYLETPSTHNRLIGLLIDSKKRLYIIANQYVEGSPYPVSLITIYRSAPLDGSGQPKNIRVWYRTAFPYNNAGYTHGVSAMIQGEDGMLYINSGSRTDAGEPGQYPGWYQGGEIDLTACIWRMDPEAEDPEPEVYARGIRNIWDFCWTPGGELLMTDNSPHVHAPEELNIIEEGKHYGFPYEFSDWIATEHYHTGLPKPEGLELVRPILNYGPDAIGSSGEPMLSFDPHSSPAGIIYCDASYPEAIRNSYLITRFGSFNPGYDTGFDLLKVTLEKNEHGDTIARSETFIAPLGRPLDLLAVGRKIYILEYRRQNGLKNSAHGPGRILELSWE